MKKDTTTQGVLFKELFGKPLVAAFDQSDSSSDGGAVLLKACDKNLGLIEAISSCLRDKRAPKKIIHSMRELVQQRVYGIACGYDDCNDSAGFNSDPVHRLLLDRDPLDGETLASQPTLSRFENRIDGRSLMKMGNAMMDCVIERHRKRLGDRARRITIDMDPRERLLKMAVWIDRSTRRFVFHLPDSAPWQSDWCRIAHALGAVPT